MNDCVFEPFIKVDESNLNNSEITAKNNEGQIEDGNNLKELDLTMFLKSDDEIAKELRSNSKDTQPTSLYTTSPELKSFNNESSEFKPTLIDKQHLELKQAPLHEFDDLMPPEPTRRTTASTATEKSSRKSQSRGKTNTKRQKPPRNPLTE